MKEENTPPIPPEAMYTAAQANEIKRLGGDLCIHMFVKRY